MLSGGAGTGWLGGGAGAGVEAAGRTVASGGFEAGPVAAGGGTAGAEAVATGAGALAVDWASTHDASPVSTTVVISGPNRIARPHPDRSRENAGSQDFHLANSFTHAHENRPRDDRVPDVELLELHLGDRPDVVVRQAVPAVDGHSAVPADLQ